MYALETRGKSNLKDIQLKEIFWIIIYLCYFDRNEDKHLGGDTYMYES